MTRPLLNRPTIASACGVAIALAPAIASAACDRLDGAGAAQAPPPPEVVVHTVESEAITLTTELRGRTAPYGIAEVPGEWNHPAAALRGRNGRERRAPLYQIDPASCETALESAQAALAQSQANLTSARLRAERYRI